MSLVNEYAVSGNYSDPVRSFRKETDRFKSQLRQLDREIHSDAVPKSGDEYHRRVQEALAESVESCSRFEEENQDDSELVAAIRSEFQRETDPWLSKSWFAHRARTKPSGFPGDYEMLRMLYLENSPPTPALGLGGYLDLCLMDSQLANGVRSRLKYAQEFLDQAVQARYGNIRILDIASGPCQEYLDWPAYDGRSVEIVAMDSDPFALDYVERSVASKLQTAVLQTVRYNAMRTRSAETNRRRFGSFDIIYSVGLCDYLTDKHLVGMLSAWRDTLEDDGVMYVAFKDSERYCKTVYQWHLDWFFYQRTVDDMLNLYRSAGFDLDAMKMHRDDTGIIVNFTYDLTEAPRRRFDSEHRLSGPKFDSNASEKSESN